jgi:protein subunit release factor A
MMLTSSIIVEIRAAEGGDDAKLLVNDMYDIYCRYMMLECL